MQALIQTIKILNNYITTGYTPETTIAFAGLQKTTDEFILVFGGTPHNYCPLCKELHHASFEF